MTPDQFRAAEARDLDRNGLTMWHVTFEAAEIMAE